MSLSLKEKIINEIRYRIEKAFPTTLVIDGTLQSETETLPCIFIFDDTVRADYHKRGRYIKTMPITVEYVFKAEDVKRIRAEGQEKIRAVVQALELDEYMLYTKEGTNEKLVLEYKMMTEDVHVFTEAIVDVVVEYEIQYAEDFETALN